MRLQDLDEWQGLTADMVRAYLERTGWKLAKVQNPKLGDFWQKDIGGDLVPLFIDHPLCDSLAQLPFLVQQSAQSLLRDINPRMRKGCPDSVSRAAHRGNWLAISPSGHGYLIRFSNGRDDDDPGFEVYRSSGSGNPASPFYDPGCSYNAADFRGGLAEWLFWPCDAAGNKVRWPEASKC